MPPLPDTTIQRSARCSTGNCVACTPILPASDRSAMRPTARTSNGRLRVESFESALVERGDARVAGEQQFVDDQHAVFEHGIQLAVLQPHRLVDPGQTQRFAAQRAGRGRIRRGAADGRVDRRLAAELDVVTDQRSDPAEVGQGRIDRPRGTAGSARARGHQAWPGRRRHRSRHRSCPVRVHGRRRCR